MHGGYLSLGGDSNSYQVYTKFLIEDEEENKDAEEEKIRRPFPKGFKVEFLLENFRRHNTEATVRSACPDLRSAIVLS